MRDKEKLNNSQLSLVKFTAEKQPATAKLSSAYYAASITLIVIAIISTCLIALFCFARAARKQEKKSKMNVSARYPV